MTWREGCDYWRAWARRTDGDIIEDAWRISHFYKKAADACGREGAGLDDPMPEFLVKRLGMDR